MTTTKVRRPRAVMPPPRKVRIGDAIGEAFSVVEELASEMNDWASSLEDKFSSTEKYANVQQAGETLEGISQPDVEPELDDIEVTIQDPKPTRKHRSRATRLGEAVNILDAVVSALEDFASSDDPNRKDEDAEAADSLREEIENAKSEIEGVEFPGMYG